MRAYLLTLVICTLLSLIIRNSQSIIIRSSVPPLSIQQFRRYSQIQLIFDARRNVSNGINTFIIGVVHGSYWTHPDGKIQNWIAYYIVPETYFLIVTDPGQQSVIASRFASTGYIHITGYNNFQMDQYPYQKDKPTILTGKQVIQIPNRVHLDVRSEQQWINSGIIQGSILIPIQELEKRLNQVKGKTNIFVNCGGAIRARLGWSVLARHDLISTVLDQSNFLLKVDFSDLAAIGFKIVPYKS